MHTLFQGRRLGGALACALVLGLAGPAAAQTMNHMDMSQMPMGTMGAMNGAATPETFAFGHPAKAGAAGRTVAIAMGDMSFTPSAVTVKAGEVVRFVVTNRSTVDHDFTLGDAATQAGHHKEMAEAMAQGGPMHHDDDPNAVMVMAGQTQTLAWVFDKPGTVEFDCNVPGHYESGMAGKITVTK